MLIKISYEYGAKPTTEVKEVSLDTIQITDLKKINMEIKKTISLEEF
jgi:hypothetical protein